MFWVVGGLLPLIRSRLPLPRWEGPLPSAHLPLGGLPSIVDKAKHVIAFQATPVTGTYNHQPMLEHVHNRFHVSWKNTVFNEDQDGQRVLYTNSRDGISWDPATVLFPVRNTIVDPSPRHRNYILNSTWFQNHVCRAWQRRLSIFHWVKYIYVPHPSC